MMERHMRKISFIAANIVAAGLIAAMAATAASAAPVPKLVAASEAPTMVEKADYARRYWRRRGYDPDAVVVEGPPLIVERPPVIVVPMMPPPRPLSCGQYKFWNGERCVDARYNPVNVGPR